MSTSLPKPLTRAEATNYLETSRHADVMRFIAELAERGDRRLTVTSFGVSPEGRGFALTDTLGAGPPNTRRSAAGRAADRAGDQRHPRRRGRGQGGQPDVDARPARWPEGGLLEQLTLLIVPLFNPDGNDRIDPANRTLDLPSFQGQLGPEAASARGSTRLESTLTATICGRKRSKCGCCSRGSAGRGSPT